MASCVETWLFFDRSICIPAFLQSFMYINKYSNKLQGLPKPRNLSFRNMKSSQPPIMIKKTVFPTTKVAVNKLGLRLFICLWCLISEIQGLGKTFLVTEDVMACI